MAVNRSDERAERAELVRGLRRIRPTLLLVCELSAVRAVAPSLRNDLATIVDRVVSFLDERAAAAPPAGPAPASGPTLKLELGAPAGPVELTWHIYAEGKSVCGKFTGAPHRWPVGHVWVRKTMAEKIPEPHRCPECWA